jgi:hypothetical protein
LEPSAAIKTAEGQKQSQILAAEGSKQAAILAAEAERQSRILRAQGERAARYLQAQGQAKAIEKVFAAIKAGRPTPEVLAYQYLQTLPQMAQGDANKVWLVPSDYGKALEGFARTLGAPGDDGVFRYEPPKHEDVAQPPLEDEEVAAWFDTSTDPQVAEAVRAAEAVARQEVPGPLSTSSPRSVPSALSSLRGGNQDEEQENQPAPLPKRSPEPPAPEFQRRGGDLPPTPAQGSTPPPPPGPQGGSLPPSGPYGGPQGGPPPRQ